MGKKGNGEKRPMMRPATSLTGAGDSAVVLCSPQALCRSLAVCAAAAHLDVAISVFTWKNVSVWMSLGLFALGAVHHAHVASAELVDGSDGINGLVKGASCVEILLDVGQQILVAAVVGGTGNPRVTQGLVGGHAFGGVNGEAALDEGARL